jgi:hypothetical protein
MRSNNLENYYEKQTGFTDETYTAAVDSGAYLNFAKDKYGFGLCQWTGDGRKAGLLRMKNERGCSIADIGLQLDHLWNELNTAYKTVLSALQSAKSVREASDIVLTKFEIPRDQSEAVKIKRAELGQKFYDQFATGEGFKPYVARVTAAILNVRKGPGMNYPIVQEVKKGSAYTIVEEQNGFGKLKSGVGWVCLEFVQFVRYA